MCDFAADAGIARVARLANRGAAGEPWRQRNATVTYGTCEGTTGKPTHAASELFAMECMRIMFTFTRIGNRMGMKMDIIVKKKSNKSLYTFHPGANLAQDGNTKMKYIRNDSCCKSSPSTTNIFPSSLWVPTPMKAVLSALRNRRRHCLRWPTIISSWLP